MEGKEKVLWEMTWRERLKESHPRHRAEGTEESVKTIQKEL